LVSLSENSTSSIQIVLRMATALTGAADTSPQSSAEDGNVNYHKIDHAKVAAQAAVRGTLHAPYVHGYLVDQRFIGDSCAVVQLPNGDWIAHVEEGLGTKGELAELWLRHSGSAAGFNCVGQDNAAMFFNDLAISGIPPVGAQMHLALGDESWLAHEARVSSLFAGMKEACLEVGAAYTGGETPVLRSLIKKDSIVLGGHAWGHLPAPGQPWSSDVQAGDVIVGFPASGVHSNGISAIRRIVRKCRSKKKWQLVQQTLTPTAQYAPVARAIRNAEIRPHQAGAITGHGARKIMRAVSPFTYVIDYRGELPCAEQFALLQELGGFTDEQMWADYNQGIGWFVIIAAADVDAVMAAARTVKFEPIVLGYVENGPKRVVIERAGITFDADTMTIR
jgi:phosphoribosylformylglycinamidine cyclo-ligase